MRNKFSASAAVLVGASIAMAIAAGGEAAGDDIVVADFESDSYAGWQIEGEAFGDRPARGYKLDVRGY